MNNTISFPFAYLALWGLIKHNIVNLPFLDLVHVKSIIRMKGKPRIFIKHLGFLISYFPCVIHPWPIVVIEEPLKAKLYSLISL